MNRDAVRSVLIGAGYEIKFEKKFNTYGWRFKLANGSAVICYDKGNWRCQGKRSGEVNALLEKHRREIDNANNRVFVVYGHDTEALEQLKSLLREWGLIPLLINELPTNGRTIIEQLEKYIPQANYGIVLATPDDVGRAKESKESDMMPRARQNVILELGMLLAKLGRSRVAIVVKHGPMERPSDIDGIIYCEYENSVREISSRLAKELRGKGYVIP